jgi:hypothetical protein
MSAVGAAPLGTKTRGEAWMLEPLKDALRRRRWITNSSVCVEEFAINGRRVDFAYMSTGRRSSAFELKIGNTGRVLEQAMYNRLSFDRSWIVVDRLPGPLRRAEARRMGIGIIVVNSTNLISIHARPGEPQWDAHLHARLTQRLLLVGGP